MNEQVMQMLIGWGPPALILGAALYMIYKGAFVTKGYVDKLSSSCDAQLASKDVLISRQDIQIAALQAELRAKDERLDKSIDTIGDAVRIIEAGPQQPSRSRSQGGSR